MYTGSEQSVCGCALRSIKWSDFSIGGCLLSQPFGIFTFYMKQVNKFKYQPYTIQVRLTRWAHTHINLPSDVQAAEFFHVSTCGDDYQVEC